MKEELVQTTVHRPKSQSRRKFISQVGITGAATLAAGVVGVEPLFQTERSQARAVQGSNQRAHDCVKIRKDAAQEGFKDTPPNIQHPANTDESLYPNKAGSYSKGLPHNNDGTVVLSAYAALVRALQRGRPSDFNVIPLGGNRKLTPAYPLVTASN